MRALLLAAAWCLCVGTHDAGAQNVQYTSKSADLGLRSDLKINPSTHGLELRIPLASYPGRAGTGLPFALNYSSKVWRMKYATYFQPSYSITGYAVIYGEHSQAGWTFSPGFPAIDTEPQLEKYYAEGGPTGGECRAGGTSGSPVGTSTCCYIDRVMVRMPDGSTHELRSTDTPVCFINSNGDTSITPPDDMYAVDGSRLRYRKSSKELFLPDGSRYVFNGSTPGGQYIDRNGNALSYDGTQWTDTLGRTLGGTLPTGSGGVDPVLSLPGVGNTAIDYTLRWRHLSDVGVLSPGEQLSWTTSPSCPTVGSQTHADSLFGGGDGCIVSHYLFDPVVLYQVVLPTGQTYTFNYNRYGEVSKVTYPTGGYERYVYGRVDSVEWLSDPYASANRGVLDRYVSASGSGADEAHWQYPTGVGGAFLNSQFMQSEITPDGALTERLMHRGGGGGAGFGYSFSEAMGGMPYEERVWSAPDGAGNRQLLRRKLTKWEATGSNATYRPDIPVPATRNGRVAKEVEILLDTGGGPALVKVTTYEYDLTFQYTTGANQTAVNEYDYVSVDRNTAQTAGVDSFIPPAQWLRRTEYDYLDDANAAYRGRNLLGLKKEMRVKDASGAVVARTVLGYDEYGLADCPSIINHDASYGAGFGTRGNATSVTSYAGAAAMTGAVTTATHYDAAGNAISAVDANGNTSYVSYADSFSDGVARNTYAYPTSTTSAAPNPAFEYGAAAGTFGSTTGLTSSASYDFSTGLATSTTDANLQTTFFDYTDPLDRLKQVTRPDGGRTTYNYVDAGQCGAYIETRTLLDAAGRETDSYQFFDGLGRPYLSETRDDQDANNPRLRVDTRYDTMGRVSQVSNPYRSPGCGAAPNPSGRWTTTAYDSLGRVTAVTTADGAAVTTAYGGNQVTVTDQAGRKRSSVSDALGRLSQVTEDPGGFNYVTAYAYDVLGNLRTVTQDTQTRSFVYDSLSRLTSATNPESGTVSYTYDANGNLKTRVDARGVTTAYTYDHLNRNILIAYSDSTPGVKRIYDTAVNGLGRYRADWTWDGGSTYYTHRAVDGYDAVGRPLNSRQHFYRNNTAGDPFATSVNYNLAGAVTREVYPSGHVVDYNYDAAGRLADRVTPNSTLPAFSGTLGDGLQRTYSSQVLYDQSGGMSQERFGTDVPLYHKRHYNSRGQPYDIRLGTASWAANEWGWDRGALINYYSSNYAREGDPTPPSADNNGNLRRQQHWVPDGSGGHTYTEDTFDYDPLNRLKSVVETLGGSAGQSGQAFAQAYAYDRWGNRTINAAGTQNTPATQFDGGELASTNRLYAPGDTALPMGQRLMRYDAAGNLAYDAHTGAGVRTYDAENRMVLAQVNSSQSATYTYDADGRRVKRNDGVGEVWQVYGLGGELLAEYDKGASPLQPRKEYGYRGGELLVTAVGASAGWGAAPTFTDPQLAGKVVQSLYVTELRQAIDSLRGHKGLGDYAWASAVGHGDPVTAESFLELRRAIDGALGESEGGYAPGLAVGQPIRAVFLEELRGRVLGAWQGGTSGVDIRWVVADQLGTPRMTVDRTGSMAGVTRHDYLPFGEEIGAGVGGRTTQQGYSQSDGVRQKFTKKERDTETTLDYFLARYYSSIQGRFTSPDEFTGGPDELYNFAEDASANPTFYADLRKPQSLNKYQYGYNNPLRYVDPDGHDPNEDQEQSKGTPLVPAPPYVPPGSPGQALEQGWEWVDGKLLAPWRERGPVHWIRQLIGKDPIPEVSPNDVPAPPMPQTAVPPSSQAQPVPPPPMHARGNRDQRKVNQGRADAAKSAADAARSERDRLRSIPNKTPEIKEALRRAERELQRQLDRMRKSETHGRKSKGI